MTATATKSHITRKDGPRRRLTLKADPPKKHFCRKVYRSMANREADYVKKGDTMRAETMKDLRNRFERSRFASQLTA